MKKVLILFFIIIFVVAGCAPKADNSSKEIDELAESYSEPVGLMEEEGFEGLDDRLGESLDENKDEDSKEEVIEKEEDIEKNVQELIKGTVPITVYYQDVDGYIVPVTRSVPMQEGIAKAAVNGLIDSTINREELEYYGLYPVLPQGTEVLGINIKEGIATIDFSNNVLNYEREIDERNIVASVVYTLTEFSTIDGVRIWINGYADKELEFGTSLNGVLNRQNVLINSEKANVQEGAQKADIYLFKAASEAYSYLVPVSRQTSGLDANEFPTAIIEMLKGKHSDKLYSEIPSETQLRESSVDGDLLTLDFDGGITKYGGGTAREEGIIKQILFSMKQIEGVERVKILIDGKTASLPEGSDVSKPLFIPQRINDVMDR
ncbi:MAG: GerMN domain-containing protein [Acetivibrionales bacterium]|jgi:germination protein M